MAQTISRIAARTAASPSVSLGHRACSSHRSFTHGESITAQGACPEVCPGGVIGVRDMMFDAVFAKDGFFDLQIDKRKVHADDGEFASHWIPATVDAATMYDNFAPSISRRHSHWQSCGVPDSFVSGTFG